MSDPAGRALLESLQVELEAIYRVQAPARAADFVIGAEAWRAWSDSGAAEELLVRESDDGLDIGFFLEDSVLRELGRPGDWTHRRLQAHCRAVEGVSHFVYLLHRAQQPRPVSQLELELQAEIDKFATVVLALWNDGRREAVSLVRRLLFEQVSYRENLTPELRERYEKANVLARGYCRFLELKYVLANSIEGFLADLRRMYRLGAGDKLGYAARAAA